MPATRTPSVSSVRRALSIIETLAHARNGMGVSVVSRKIHAPKSSTHTILLTLERCGFLRRDEKTGHYLLGMKILTLGNALLGDTDVREKVRGYFLDIVEKTRRTGQLVVLGEDQLRSTLKMDSPALSTMKP